MLLDDNETVVNKIQLVHIDATGIKGYSLSFEFAPSLYEPIIDEEILLLRGNDTVLYVNSFDGRDTNFYRISHLYGDTVISVKKVDVSTFRQESTTDKMLYKWR